MRPTIHMVSADDFRLFAEGSRCVHREWWLRFQRAQLDGIDTDAAADRIRIHLAAGPRQVPEGGTRTRSTQSLHQDRQTRAWPGMVRATSERGCPYPSEDERATRRPRVDWQRRFSRGIPMPLDLAPITMDWAPAHPVPHGRR